MIGILSISAWACLWSLLFCHVALKGGHLRLSEQDEILGGDLHYFGPAEFDGNVDELKQAIYNIKGSDSKESQIVGLPNAKSVVYPKRTQI